MRKKANKLLALLTAVAITVTGVNVPANNASAASVKLSAKKVTLTAGKKKTIYLKKGKKKLAIKSVKSSKKKVATVKKSGKKIVITAKKKGTATITVKAKVNKKVKSFKCKVTVKAKATPTAAPSATASSAPASQAPASAVPSDAASAQPSDDASAAPSADVSAQPSADASAEPSKEPSIATEIVIKDTVALTGLDNQDKHTIAYAAYDVLDQYGESVRDSVSISWTASAGTVRADKSTGLLTISKGTGSEEFVFGSLLVLVGVDTTHGLSKQAQLTIGMERAVDSIDFVGFVSKDAKSKKEDIKDTLPANFAKDTWMFLYTAKDQNGNPMEATGQRKANKELSFIGNNPTLLDVTKSDDADIVTIDGMDYDAIWVQPGMYVDKGGEVTLSVMSNKTGTSNNHVYTIGAGNLLKSVTLIQPTETVADGDSGVEIPYEAVDVNGDKVTAYETIVRSTNTFSMNAGDGTLTVKEEDDGTAGFYWSDDTKYYNVKRPELYKDKGEYPADYHKVLWGDTKYDNKKTPDIRDGQDRRFALTTTVVGGESKSLIFSVSDARIPTKIDSISANSLDTDAFVVNGKGKIATADNTDHQRITYKDQYGKALNKEAAVAFFKATEASASDDGAVYNGYHYGVKVKTSKTNTLSLYQDETFTGIDNNINITATLDEKKSKTYSNSVSFAIAKIKNKTYADAVTNSTNAEKNSYGATTLEGQTRFISDAWDVEGKAVKKTYWTGQITSVKNFELAGLGKVGIETAYTSHDNGASISDADMETGITATVGGATGSAFRVVHGSGNASISVTGTIENIKVSVPAIYYDMADNPTGKSQAEFNGDDKSVVYSVTGLNWNELYDTNSAKHVRKDASVKVGINVFSATSSALQIVSKSDPSYNADTAPVTLLETISKNLTVSDANPEVTEVKLCARYSIGKTAFTYNPDNMEMDGYYGDDDDKSVVSTLHDSLWSYNGYKPRLLAISQYNEAITEGTPIFTVSDPKESPDLLTHVANSLNVTKNGSKEVFVTGAEIGDTFTLTGYVEGYEAIKATATVTMGADQKAYIDSDGNDSDKTFRKDVLKAYDR